MDVLNVMDVLDVMDILDVMDVMDVPVSDHIESQCCTVRSGGASIASLAESDSQLPKHPQSGLCNYSQLSGSHKYS